MSEEKHKCPNCEPSSWGATFFNVGIIILHVLLLYLLWNWLATRIFSLPQINLFEALGLRFLGYCLFSSWPYKIPSNERGENEE